MRLVPIISLAALAALAACASTPPRQYGQYSALQPRFATVGKEGTRPDTLTVTLTQAANVAVLFVVPGRGATLVYPADSTTSNHLNGGTERIAVKFPKAPARDSILRRRAAERTTDRRRGGRSGANTPLTRDTMPRFLADTSLGLASGGYLLMLASPSPLSYSAIRRRTEGVSIPLDDDEALNTVVKLVRGTLPEGSAWAALSKEIDIDVGAEMAQQSRRMRGR